MNGRVGLGFCLLSEPGKVRAGKAPSSKITQELFFPKLPLYCGDQ